MGLAWAQTTPTPPGSSPKWGAHLDIEGKVGNERQLGEGDLFVPLLQNDRTMLFGNVKARLDDNASSEGNFGVGVRHMLDAGLNLGAYGFFDRRRTEHQNYFNQVTLGAEALSTDWDLRANVYLPEGRRSHNVDSLNTASLEGTTTVVFRGGEERSLTGFDGEIGYRVPVFKADEDRQWRVFAGAYRFYGDGVNAVQGPRVRTELTFDEIEWLWAGSRMTWGGEFQDDIRGKTGFVTARLRIPLQVFGQGRSVASLTPLERRMTDPIVRDIDVVSRAGAFGAPETVSQAADGRSLTVLNSATTTTGAALNTALTNAGGNASVILSGSFNVAATQISLPNGQKVMAGNVEVLSPSGRTAVVSTSATISGVNSGQSTVLVNSNNTLSGLTINTTFSGGAGGRAILIADTAGGSVIANNTITVNQTGANVGVGISAGANVNATISGNRITLTGSGGATILHALAINSGGTFTVSNNTISASGGTTNNIVTLGGTEVISAGSTGNVRGSGVCSGNPASGTISFTNGTTCP